MFGECEPARHYALQLLITSDCCRHLIGEMKALEWRGFVPAVKGTAQQLLFRSFLNKLFPLVRLVPTEVPNTIVFNRVLSSLYFSSHNSRSILARQPSQCQRIKTYKSTKHNQLE